MAKFIFEKIKIGNLNEEYSYINSISDIVFDDGEKIVVLPEKINGEVVTHFNYTQIFEEGYERWHDWHHPAQGTEYIPPKYDKTSSNIVIPKYVEKIVIPKTITDIATSGLKIHDNFLFEIDSENPRYEVKNDALYYKNYDVKVMTLKRKN